MLTLVTAPTTEPLSVSEARTQLRLGTSDGEPYPSEDSQLLALIQATRERGEEQTARAFCTQTWDLVLDGFPSDPFVEAPKPPLQLVTHVKYRDTAGTLQTWASSNYVVEAPAGPRCARGRISLAYGITWPSTYGQAGDVQIRLVCGYGAASAVPSILRSAMLLDLATLYANAENVILGVSVATLPGGSQDIYRRYHSPQTQRRAA